LAIIPVVVVTSLYGAEGTAKLLVLSQVILSMQLPFAIVPLMRFVSDRKLMGNFVTGPVLTTLSCAITLLIIGLNLVLLVGMFRA
jgi:manganese transport protein